MTTMTPRQVRLFGRLHRRFEAMAERVAAQQRYAARQCDAATRALHAMRFEAHARAGGAQIAALDARRRQHLERARQRAHAEAMACEEQQRALRSRARRFEVLHTHGHAILSQQQARRHDEALADAEG